MCSAEPLAVLSCVGAGLCAQAGQQAQITRPHLASKRLSLGVQHVEIAGVALAVAARSKRGVGRVADRAGADAVHHCGRLVGGVRGRRREVRVGKLTLQQRARAWGRRTGALFLPWCSGVAGRSLSPP